MGYKTKIQAIERRGSRQYYVTIPSAIALAMELEKGEEFEWLIETRKELRLKRSGGR